MYNTKSDKLISAMLTTALLVLNLVPFHHNQTAYCSNDQYRYTIRTTTHGFPVAYSESTYAEYDCLMHGKASSEQQGSSPDFLIQAVCIDILVVVGVYMLVQLFLEARRRKK
jgi:hypothetical protein